MWSCCDHDDDNHEADDHYKDHSDDDHYNDHHCDDDNDHSDVDDNNMIIWLPTYQGLHSKQTVETSSLSSHSLLSFDLYV